MRVEEGNVNDAAIEDLGDEEHKEEANEPAHEPVDAVARAPPAEEDVVVVSSDEEEGAAGVQMCEASVEVKFEEDEQMDPAQYGDLANLAFLRGSEDTGDVDEISVINDPYHQQPDNRRRPRRKAGRNEVIHLDEAEEEDEDSDEAGSRRMNAGVASASVARAASDEYISNQSESSYGARARKCRKTRLDKYSRDGAWFPSRQQSVGDDEKEWYDTDSDLLTSKPGAISRMGKQDLDAHSEEENEFLE